MKRRLPLLPFIVPVCSLAGATAANLDITIRELNVPTPKSRPHDPAIAPDGAR
jgi:hypothetical protein